MDKTLAPGYYLMTPMFDGVSTDGLDIQTIAPKHPSAAVKSGEFTMYMIDNNRTTIDAYVWYPLTKIGEKVLHEEGWFYNTNSNLKVSKEFAAGEGFMLWCKLDSIVNFSGEVQQIEPKFVAEAAGYYRVGNLNPTPLEIQDIAPSNNNGEKLSSGQFTIYTFDTERKSDDAYVWYPLTKIGEKVLHEEGWFYNTNNNVKVSKEFAAGDGFMFWCKYPATLTFPEPIK